MQSPPTISADGRFVAYRSDASDIVAGDDNGQSDVFLFDRLTGQNELVSLNPNGSPGNDRSVTPIISADGSTIVFRSLASDLVGGDFNNTQDVFLFPVSANPPAVPSPFSARAALLPGSNQVLISWEAMPGQSYRVQYKNDLSEANWNEVSGGAKVSGSKATCVDDAPTAFNQRFYRIDLVE